MKIQNLSIIFLVIAIPLIMILSYYLDLQKDTLKLQTEYDTKLAEATKEGIKAFEVNTVDWSEWVSEKTRITERDDARAAINTVITSLANNLNISGTAKEYMVNYIPAIAVTMYDGYYIYAPNYVPVTIENHNGVQLYYDTSHEVLTTNSDNGNNIPAYEPKEGEVGITREYEYTTDEGSIIKENINFVTKVAKAKTEYRHILSSQISYVERYSKNSDTDVVVNYTLDNRIYVYGTVDGTRTEKDGYLVYFGNDTKLPRITIDSTIQNDTAIDVEQNIETVYDNDEIITDIKPEILTEQVLFYDGGEYKLGTFKYVYDISHNKLYYDEIKQNFFTIDSASREKDFLANENNVKVGSDECKYKSVSVLLVNDDGTIEHKKIYQVLNGRDKGQWCINIKEDSEEAKNAGKEEIDTKIGDSKIQELGLINSKDTDNICKDYSAINYYVEAYAFTNWIGDNLGDIKVEVEGTQEKIFKITGSNNPEKEGSPIVVHKEQVMKENIITNLNLSISNYSMGTYEFKLPVLTDNDWDQVFSNISIITFFQGIPIGLKYYNNYSIATSTTNREYVDPEEIYLSGEDASYHRANCEKCEDTTYTGYRSVEYSLKEFIKDDDRLYYYQHDNSENTNSETACYYCLVNRANYIATAEPEIKEKQNQSYNEALARERYYQKEDIKAKMNVNIIYYDNIDAYEGAIYGCKNLPDAEEVEIGTYRDILGNPTPTVESNFADAGIEFVFAGWSDTPGATSRDDITHHPGGKVFMNDEDLELYAVWVVSLSKLEWNVDVKFNDPKEAFKDYSKKEFNNTSTGSNISDGSISYIYVDRMPNSDNNGDGILDNNGDRVQMIGNQNLKGKGAVWVNFGVEGLDLNISEFSFDYYLNAGHSFNAGGMLFNIEEYEESGAKWLKGYMLSINLNHEMLSAAQNKTGAIFKFKYKIGNNGEHFEELIRKESFDLGEFNSSVGSSGDGRISIKVEGNGYRIEVDDKVHRNEDIIIELEEDEELNQNSFGFFSDHFGTEHGHSCSNVGYFRLENVIVTVE